MTRNLETKAKLRPLARLVRAANCNPRPRVQSIPIIELPTEASF